MEDLHLKIDDKEFEAKFSKKDPYSVAINDKIYNVELLKQNSDSVFSFAVNQKLKQVDLEFDKDGNLAVNMDGFYYTVEIADSGRASLEKLIGKKKSAMDSGVIAVKAPMPGLVVKIFCEKDSLVMKGDKIIVVEAMKMENVLKSPVTGKVKSIKVKEGSPVNKDELMIEIEAGN